MKEKKVFYTTEKIGYRFKNWIFGDAYKREYLKKGFKGISQKEKNKLDLQIKKYNDYMDIKIQLDIIQGAI